MSEIEKLLSLNYNECCTYLIKKYGQPKKPYFADNIKWNKTSGITRGKEGLYIHHIDEDKAIMLSKKDYAKNNPFAYQQPDRLVYCDLLEHLVLHIKIVQHPHPKKNKNEAVGIGGIYNFIVPELNDIYSGIKYKSPWKQQVINNVIKSKQDYLKCIEFILKNNICLPIQIFYSFNFLYSWDINKNRLIFQQFIDIIKKLKLTAPNHQQINAYLQKRNNLKSNNFFRFFD